MRHSRSRGLVGGLLVATVVSGCGGGGDTTGEVSDDLQVEATEYAFDPENVSVPAGEEVTLALDNQGQLLHEWVIIEQGTTLEDSGSFQEDMVVFETEAPPGEAATIAFTAPEAGTYQVVCAQPGHIEQGMTGTLESVAAD